MRDIVTVGASAGGVEALMRLVSALPHDYPGSLFVVLHTAPNAPGLLPAILTRSGPLPAISPADGEEIRPRIIYVAPPDHHLLLRPGHIHLSRGPRENATRPAVNPTFRSAATAYGARVVGVVLTGTLDNGTAGMIAIRRAGGLGIAQDPADALYPDMPQNAIDFADPEHVLPLAGIPPLLVRVAQEGGRPGKPTLLVQRSPDAPSLDLPGPVELPMNGASGYSCPECAGSLWEVTEGDMAEYRCRIGHVYSQETLMQELSDHADMHVASMVRALEEQAVFAELLAHRATERVPGSPRATRYARLAEKARERVEQYRQIARVSVEDPNEVANG